MKQLARMLTAGIQETRISDLGNHNPLRNRIGKILPGPKASGLRVATRLNQKSLNTSDPQSIRDP
jgi:hypothetical protein